MDKIGDLFWGMHLSDNHCILIHKGCVNEPYSRYPNFLETLLNFLRTEQRGTIRGQTLRLLGLLGALDPYRHKMAIGQIGGIFSSAG